MKQLFMKTKHNMINGEQCDYNEVANHLCVAQGLNGVTGRIYTKYAVMA